MIVSNRFVRTYLFGSKVARIHNKSFEYCVSTAKEGWFRKLSTIIFEPRVGNTVGAGAAGFRPCGKVIYSPTLRKSDRLQLHDVIVKTLDAFGEEGCTLEQALEQIFADLKRRGIAVVTMNFAADQGQADAQFNLGGPRTNGEGVTQGDTQMAARFRRNAEQGNADAQFNSGICTTRARACPRTMRKPQRSIARRLNRASLKSSLILARRTVSVKGCPEIMLRLCFGLARLLSKVTPWHRLALASCAERAGVCPKISQRPFLVRSGGCWQAEPLGLETGCEVSRRGCINPNASRSCPRTGTGAEMV